MKQEFDEKAAKTRRFRRQSLRINRKERVPMLVEVNSGKTKCSHCGKLFKLTESGVVLTRGAAKPICGDCLDQLLAEELLFRYR